MRKLHFLILIMIAVLGQSLEDEISKCEWRCYYIYIKSPKNMSYQEYCSATQRFVTCVKDVCKMPELHPKMKENVLLIVEDLEKYKINCDIKY